MKEQFFDGNELFLYSTSIPGYQDIEGFLTNVWRHPPSMRIIGTDLDGKILLWNEARRLAERAEAQEVVGLVNAEMLHAAENGQGSWKYISDAALHDDKWEGIVGRMARTSPRQPMSPCSTPRWAGDGQPVGFLRSPKTSSTNCCSTQHKKNWMSSSAARRLTTVALSRPG